MSTQPSDTFKKFYLEIIDELFYIICKNYPDLCIKSPTIQYQLWNKFDEYRKKALTHMSKKRLDRHKLASCMCGAIIEVKPLVKINKLDKSVEPKIANELLALYVGLNIIKAFIINDILDESHDLLNVSAKDYLKAHYEMAFPENICDTQEYLLNFANALSWSHSKCEILKKECFHYDIWAYAKIFYHLDLYNQGLIRDCYIEYTKQHIKT